MELIILGLFSAALLICIAFGHSIFIALLSGYCLFFFYGLLKKFSYREILKMSWKGIKTVKNILITFILIGMITAVWRDSGTIPFIIFYSSKIISSSIFILITFLLCCLISSLTGTAFGSAATLGIICMAIANTMEINPVFTGGAILSGVYFGDRCSFMSTSALLVSELTGTDIYINIKNMMRTSLVPFAASCVLYFALGINSGGNSVSTEILDVFRENFNLNLIVLLPAILIIVLCAFRIKVKIAMSVSILSASLISLFIQQTSFSELLSLLLLGFKPSDSRLAVMMSGGGVVSMLRTMGIVCISSSYAGIFEGTSLLHGIKLRIISLSKTFTAYGCILISSVLTSMIACNQTLSIMLTHYLCKDTIDNKERLAVNLENTVVVIAPLIPWSIAGAVPLTAVGAPVQSILAAFYLFLLPLWNFFYNGKTMFCIKRGGEGKSGQVSK